MKKKFSGDALVVLSGGQDSATCLGVARRDFPDAGIHAITFEYGQRHWVEVECAQTVGKIFGVESHKIVKAPSLLEVSGDSDLLKSGSNFSTDKKTGLPTSVVYGRNLIFLTLAAAYARSLNIRTIYTGVCQTDYSGYPDCRDDTIKALQVAINLGMDSQIEIRTPLMYMTKAESVKLAGILGVLNLLEYTNTCYNGVKGGCGTCPACKLRDKGFTEAGFIDPLWKHRTGNKNSNGSPISKTI